MMPFGLTDHVGETKPEVPGAGGSTRIRIDDDKSVQRACVFVLGTWRRPR